MIYETFFENLHLTTERVILAEDVVLGDSPKPISGKFFFPILTPTLNMETPYDQPESIYGNSNIHGVKINTSQFIKSNYIELQIPTHIQYEFFYKYEVEKLDKIKEKSKSLYNIYDDFCNELTYNPEEIDIHQLLYTFMNTMKEQYNQDEESTDIVIPKGTEFIITGIGTSYEYNDIRIIGVWTQEEEVDNSESEETAS